jgi:hypothetical protein
MTENTIQSQADNLVTLVDLQNVLVIFDLASSRGAFRGGELQPIGQLYDKINRFLQSAMPPKTENAEESTTVAQGSEVTSAGV